MLSSENNNAEILQSNFNIFPKKVNGSGSTDGEVKVISYVLFAPRNRYGTVNWIDYITGLYVNLLMRRIHFPEYTVVLYTEPCLMRGGWASTLSWIRSKFTREEFQMVRIPDELLKYPLLARYEPIFDPRVDVALVRDTDSILSGRDANIVQKHVVEPYRQSSKDKDKNRRWNLLVYREHLMEAWGVMGGGVSAAGRSWRNKHSQCDLIRYAGNSNHHRGYDEIFLMERFGSILRNDHNHNRDMSCVRTCTTRMNKAGDYFVKHENGGYSLLWSCSQHFGQEYELCRDRYIETYGEIPYIMDKENEKYILMDTLAELEYECEYNELHAQIKTRAKQYGWVR